MSFDQGYKQVRNRVKSLNLDDLYSRIILHMRQWENTPPEVFEHNQPMPWLLIYMLKLCALHGGSNQNVSPAENIDFIRIYNQLHELDGDYQMALLNEDGIHSFVTATAFKQFWYQQGLYRGDFARANFLFREPDGHVASSFLEENGFSTREYVEMIVALWVYTSRHLDSLYVNYKNRLMQFGHSEAVVNSFLGMISRTKEELRNELREQDGAIRSYLLQFGEHTPLFRFPLLKVNEDESIVFSKTVLERALCLNLFEYAKYKSGDEGLADFADRFEDYIHELLLASGAETIRENEIGEQYEGKKTDFLVIEDDLAIMIEAKSVRLPDIARANPTREIITNSLKDNVIKAIFQGHELSNKLFEEDDSREFVLIVVTYDDIYLGAPETAYEHYFEAYCEQQFEEGNFTRGHLQPKAIFTVSTKDFELVCRHALNSGGFKDLLETAISSNDDPATRKLSLTMYCEDDHDEELGIIEENYEALWAAVVDRIP